MPLAPNHPVALGDPGFDMHVGGGYAVRIRNHYFVVLNSEAGRDPALRHTSRLPSASVVPLGWPSKHRFARSNRTGLPRRRSRLKRLARHTAQRAGGRVLSLLRGPRLILPRSP